MDILHKQRENFFGTEQKKGKIFSPDKIMVKTVFCAVNLLPYCLSYCALILHSIN